jgi:large subunit ribosomal protein L25
MITLAVEKRASEGAKAPALIRAGSIPAVVYGPHHESTSLVLPAVPFEKVLKEAGEASIVMLLGLGGEPVPTLIHEVDLDPLTNRPRHVDFYAVTKGEKIEVAIPLVFVGESTAVKAGANLVKVLHEVEIEADPMGLPHDIKVDLSLLKVLNDQIHVRDLIIPADVTLVTNPDDVIAIAQEVTVEKEEVAPASLDSIEVEKKGKDEPAEGEAPTASAE